MSHVISWFHVPAEESVLVAYLAKSGALWAFAWHLDPTRPEYPAAPVAEFFVAHGDALTCGYQETSARRSEENAAYWADPNAVRPNRNDWGQPTNVVYIGLRDAVCAPRIEEIERLEGGAVEPTDQPGVGRIVGATTVVRRTVATANELVRYSRATWLAHLDAFDGATLSYASTGSSDAFQRVGKLLFGWVRRWTPCSVPVSGANYENRATQGAADAAATGIRFV